MFRSIVVGTDGSEGAARAIDAAEMMARCGTAADAGPVDLHVVVAHQPVVTWQLSTFAIDALMIDKVIEAAADAAREQLDEVVADLRKRFADDSVRVTGHVLSANADDAIISTAEAADADLIVVGHRGLGFGKRLLLGSVSSKVAHHARCAVLIAETPKESEAD